MTNCGLQWFDMKSPGKKCAFYHSILCMQPKRVTWKKLKGVPWQRQQNSRGGSLEQAMRLPIILNHLPGRKSRRQIPARYWPWESHVNSLFGNRGGIRAWKKSPRLQGDNTHIEGEGQFLWDYQSRKCYWHPHSAEPECGGVDLPCQRRRGNLGGRPPSKASWNREPGVTNRVTWFSHPTFCSGFFRITFPRPKEGGRGPEVNLAAMRQWKMPECLL